MGNRAQGEHSMKPNEELAGIARKYADACEWLEACPFDDGQPFYETANAKLEEWLGTMNQLAHDMKDEALVESISAATIDGEYGDGFEHNEPAFWRYIARWAEDLK